MATNVGPGLETRGRRRQKPVEDGPVTEDQLQSHIAYLTDVTEVLEQQIGRAVAMLRCYGRSWHFVGTSLGMTAEGARRKYEADCDLFNVPRRVTAEMVPGLVRHLPPATLALSMGGA